MNLYTVSKLRANLKEALDRAAKGEAVGVIRSDTVFQIKAVEVDQPVEVTSKEESVYVHKGTDTESHKPHPGYCDHGQVKGQCLVTKCTYSRYK